MQPSDFSSLYQSSYAYIYQLVFSVSQNRQSTEDTVQEIYLAAWIRFRAKAHPNPFGWLVITARHKACDALRRQLREAKHLIPLDFGTDANLCPGIDSLCSDCHPESETAYEHIRPLLKQEEFYLILAHYEYGIPVAELADRMRISPGACYMRLHRARRKLAPLMPSRPCAADQDRSSSSRSQQQAPFPAMAPASRAPSFR